MQTADGDKAGKTLSAEGRERLQRVADLLEDIRKNDFNMSRWNSCALGEASRHRWFQERGLGTTERGSPTYDGKIGHEAAAGFFGTTRAASQRLFNGDRSLTAGDAARRIREFCDE